MITDRIQVNVAGGLEVALPNMMRVRQKFPTPKLDSVSDAVRAQMGSASIRERIQSGMSTAVGCGSRGVTNIAECVGSLVQELKALKRE